MSAIAFRWPKAGCFFTSLWLFDLGQAMGKTVSSAWSALVFPGPAACPMPFRLPRATSLWLAGGIEREIECAASDKFHLKAVFSCRQSSQTDLVTRLAEVYVRVVVCVCVCCLCVAGRVRACPLVLRACPRVHVCVCVCVLQ